MLFDYSNLEPTDRQTLAFLELLSDPKTNILNFIFYIQCTLPMLDSLDLPPRTFHKKPEEDSPILEVVPEVLLRLDPLELLPALLGVVPDPVPGRLPGHLHASPAHREGS